MSTGTSASELLPLAAAAAQRDDQSFVRAEFFRLASLLEQEDSASAAVMHRQLLRSLLDRNASQIRTLNYPDSIKTMVLSEFERIKLDTIKRADEYFCINTHALRCDYRIACFGRIPAGVEHLEIGGIPRSLVYRGDLSQAFSFFRCIKDVGGRRPLFNIHLRHGIKPWTFLLVYSQEAQRQLYLSIAESLHLNADIKGLIATSWWYDPALETLSPHMAFLRKTMQENGAYLFRYREQAGHSLVNSPLRQALFAQGKYRPCSYTVVWPRSQILSWADTIS